MFQESILQGQTAIVTGGSRGIGAAITQLLAEQGAKVFFTYHTQANTALEAEKQGRAKGLDVTAVMLDVRDQTQCATLVQTIQEQTGRIDILVNNSGVIKDNLLLMLEPEDIRTVIDTNLLGVMYMTQAVSPFMIRQRGGKIINISSIAAEKGGRGQSNYAASKGAINSFTKAMAVELASKRITVNAVSPGVIATDMSKELRELAGDEVILDKILLKRYGEAKDIAYAVGFLASPYANYITGENLHVDGGFKMG